MGPLPGVSAGAVERADVQQRNITVSSFIRAKHRESEPDTGVRPANGSASVGCPICMPPARAIEVMLFGIDLAGGGASALRFFVHGQIS
jgi:hypothetical protein